MTSATRKDIWTVLKLMKGIVSLKMQMKYDALDCAFVLPSSRYWTIDCLMSYLKNRAASEIGVAQICLQILLRVAQFWMPFNNLNLSLNISKAFIRLCN